jgi:hypothetical protein
MVVGAIAGAVVSGGSEYVRQSERKKEKARAETSAEFGGVRPKHRKVARIGKAVQEALNNKQRALIAMAQAHQNYASSF